MRPVANDVAPTMLYFRNTLTEQFESQVAGDGFGFGEFGHERIVCGVV